VKQEEAVGRRITARGKPERSSHVAGDLYKLRRGGARGGVSNVGSPVLGWDSRCYNKVEDVLVKLCACWRDTRRDGEGGGARRAMVERR